MDGDWRLKLLSLAVSSSEKSRCWEGSWLLKEARLCLAPSGGRRHTSQHLQPQLLLPDLAREEPLLARSYSVQPASG
ncbi:hypothetical protein HYQ46_011191 [Verticillium longisporum]|nr:hypothetical protein HYQ46_011191 [Verticillium longisporum]